MGAVIPVWILGYDGQVIKEVRQDETTGKITVTCRRSSAAEGWQLAVSQATRLAPPPA